MTEREMEAARRVYDLQTRPSVWEQVARWWRNVRRPAPSDREKRRARLDRRAEIERAAKERL